MADSGFNGSTISFGGAGKTPLLSISWDDTAAEVQVTGAGDSSHTFEAGIPNITCTFELVANPGLATGTEGAIAIAWNDGTSDSLTNAVITAVSTTGSLDNPLSTSVTVKETAA